MLYFPLIFFLKVVVLGTFLGESSKKGMYCKCVRNGAMSNPWFNLYTNQDVFLIKCSVSMGFRHSETFVCRVFCAVSVYKLDVHTSVSVKRLPFCHCSG